MQLMQLVGPVQAKHGEMQGMQTELAYPIADG